jgi:hypothetical protein
LRPPQELSPPGDNLGLRFGVTPSSCTALEIAPVQAAKQNGSIER